MNIDNGGINTLVSENFAGLHSGSNQNTGCDDGYVLAVSENDALTALHRMIDRKNRNKQKE